MSKNPKKKWNKIKQWNNVGGNLNKIDTEVKSIQNNIHVHSCRFDEDQIKKRARQMQNEFRQVKNQARKI